MECLYIFCIHTNKVPRPLLKAILLYKCLFAGVRLGLGFYVAANPLFQNVEGRTWQKQEHQADSLFIHTYICPFFFDPVERPSRTKL